MDTQKILTYLSKAHEDVPLQTKSIFHSQYAKSDNITTSDTLYVIDGGIEVKLYHCLH